MASRNESGKRPGTSFAGTLFANLLTSPVPGMAWPGLLGLGISVCARAVAAPQSQTPANQKKRRHSLLSLKGVSFLFVTLRCVIPGPALRSIRVDEIIRPSDVGAHVVRLKVRLKIRSKFTQMSARSSFKVRSN